MIEFRLENGATEVLLVRHADARPDDGALDADPTYLDAPLNARGREQAALLAERLASERIDAIYASSTRRAGQTAHVLAEAMGLNVTVIPELREVAIGPVVAPQKAAAATPAQRARAHLAFLAEFALAHGGWSEIDGTEPAQQVRERMNEALTAIASAHPGGRVVAVSHAGAINASVASAIGLTSDFFFPAANASITVMRVRASRRMLITLNDTAHLRIAQERPHAAR